MFIIRIPLGVPKRTLLMYNKEMAILVQAGQCVRMMNSEFGALERRTENEAAWKAERLSTSLWTAEFQGGNRCGLRRKRLYGLETNGGSHQHPPAPGCGELKNRL
jgi:hypothetical protein